MYAYFLVPETKGLTLEQVDQMFAETLSSHSPGRRPTHSFPAVIDKIEGSYEHKENKGGLRDTDSA